MEGREKERKKRKKERKEREERKKERKGRKIEKKKTIAKIIPNNKKLLFLEFINN